MKKLFVLLFVAAAFAACGDASEMLLLMKKVLIKTRLLRRADKGADS